MRPLVYLEVLRPGEDFAAAGEGAGERLLAGVDPDVVDQLVLRLEGPAGPGAALPEAGVRRALGPPDVVHRQVGDDLVHGAVHLTAALPSLRPQALEPASGPRVAEERPRLGVFLIFRPIAVIVLAVLFPLDQVTVMVVVMVAVVLVDMLSESVQHRHLIPYIPRAMLVADWHPGPPFSPFPLVTTPTSLPIGRPLGYAQSLTDPSPHSLFHINYRGFNV